MQSQKELVKYTSCSKIQIRFLQEQVINCSNTCKNRLRISYSLRWFNDGPFLHTLNKSGLFEVVFALQ